MQGLGLHSHPPPSFQAMPTLCHRAAAKAQSSCVCMCVCVSRTAGGGARRWRHMADDWGQQRPLSAVGCALPAACQHVAAPHRVRSARAGRAFCILSSFMCVLLLEERRVEVELG
eukprot:171089-Pelagomonas_calceolata.AAC.2